MRIAACLVPALVFACGCASLAGDPAQQDARTLASWLSGVFDNKAQHEADRDHFFPIHLVMRPIWTQRSDGPWLYVEQAIETKLDKPYRQRVYRVVAADVGRAVHVDVFELPGDPLDHAGAWRKPDPLADLDVRTLLPREGCAVHLVRIAQDRFEGSTHGHGCASTLAGAAYATSEVTVTPKVMRSLDRGWSASAEQAWGSTQGPYEFVKRSGTFGP
jgi:hypothetical protein